MTFISSLFTHQYNSAIEKCKDGKEQFDPHLYNILHRLANN